MGRYRAIDYTSGGNNFASGLNNGMALAARGLQLYQAGKKMREEEERKAALQEVAEAEAVQEVNPNATGDAADYAAAAQNPDVMKHPEAQAIYMQQPGVSQYRLGDVTSEKPLTPEQEADARLGMQQQALNRLGDVEGGIRLGRERIQGRQAAQQAELTGVQLSNAKQAQADDAAARAVRNKTGEFLKSRLTVTDGNGVTSTRAATDDDWIATGLHQAELYLQEGRTDKALEVHQAVRQQQVALLTQQAAERKRAGAEVLARLQANPTDTNAAVAYYDKYLPDGKRGGMTYDAKADSYTLTQDGKPSITLKRSEMLEAIASTADTSYAMAFLDREAKRAEIAKDKADAAKTTKTESREAAKAERDKRQLEATDELNAAYASGDAKAIAAARRKAIAAGVKIKEAGETKFVPNPMGMGGTIVQTQADGSIEVTPVSSNNTKGKTLRQGAPGTPDAPAQVFASEAEAEAAAKAGKLPSGSRVVINGVAGTWQ